MKKRMTLCALLCVALFSAVQANVNGRINDEDIRQALYGALDNAKADLKAAPFGQKTIALLPFKGPYERLFDGRLKNMVTAAGFVCVEAKEDPMWDEIIKEFAWDERKNDILDPQTVARFGKLKAAQILLYGSVKVLDGNGKRIYAEIELHATDIVTKRHVWGGNFAHRFYKGDDVKGIVELDESLRLLLKKNFDVVRQSLLSAEVAGKLSTARTVSVIPLAGDIDRYITGLAIEALTQTRHQPKSPRIPSLSQVRVSARDGQLANDAIFYGAVRDLYVTPLVLTPLKKEKRMQESYTVSADIQLFMEDVRTGVVLWSKTVTLSETLSSVREMTAREVAWVRQEKFDAAPAAIKEDVIDNWKFYLVLVLSVVGGIVVLIALVIGIKAFVSYNNVR